MRRKSVLKITKILKIMIRFQKTYVEDKYKKPDQF